MFWTFAAPFCGVSFHSFPSVGSGSGPCGAGSRGAPALALSKVALIDWICWSLSLRLWMDVRDLCEHAGCVEEHHGCVEPGAVADERGGWSRNGRGGQTAAGSNGWEVSDVCVENKQRLILLLSQRSKHTKAAMITSTIARSPRPMTSNSKIGYVETPRDRAQPVKTHPLLHVGCCPSSGFSAQFSTGVSKGNLTRRHAEGVGAGKGAAAGVLSCDETRMTVFTTQSYYSTTVVA